MTKADFVQNVLAAAHAGTLVTLKHDPSGVAIPYANFRTVLTAAASSSLTTELGAGNFRVAEYVNPKYANHQFVVELSSSVVTPVGLGIPSGSTTPSNHCDRLVFVSGSQQGWHVYGEEQQRINDLVASGSLAYLNSLA